MIICIRFTAQHNLVNRKDPTVSCGRCRPDCILWPMPTRPHPVADARQTVPCGRCRSGCIVCPMPTQLYRVADAMPDQAVSCGRCRPDCIVWPNPNRPDCIVWPDPNRPGCIVWPDPNRSGCIVWPDPSRPDCIVWPDPNRPDCIVRPNPNRPDCIVRPDPNRPDCIVSPDPSRNYCCPVADLPQSSFVSSRLPSQTPKGSFTSSPFFALGRLSPSADVVRDSSRRSLRRHGLRREPPAPLRNKAISAGNLRRVACSRRRPTERDGGGGDHVGGCMGHELAGDEAYR